MSNASTNPSAGEELPTEAEIQRLKNELERLLADPRIPDDAKEALRNHELVALFENARRANVSIA